MPTCMDVAVDNRRAGKPAPWGRRDAFKHQIMVRYFGWERRDRSDWGRQFKVAGIGEKQHRAGRVSLSRAHLSAWKPAA